MTTYQVTGINARGQRFRRTGLNRTFAMAINVYRGTVWKVVDGKRTVVKRVSN